MKIGIFGGSFDPVHFGHLNLALQMLEIHQLDQILFCPAACSPFKKEHPPLASAAHRLAMLKQVLQEIPQCAVSSIEIDRGGNSYTIDTLRALEKKGTQLHLILSEEAAAHFSRWKEPEEILRIAPPLVGTRGKGLSIPEPLKKGITSTRTMEISSTEVRERLKKKLYCGHLVPAKALDYIHSHHLYSA